MTSSYSGLSIITWKRSIWHTGNRVFVLASFLTRFHVKCFSARRSRTSRSLKMQPKPQMQEESDAFYVVRKGDIVGIYKRLSDCQAQVGSSVCDPPVSVYKGYSLPKETEDYLASQGLKDALYSMHAAHLKDDIFGTLVPCSFQQPDSLAFLVDKAPKRSSTRKREEEVGIASSCDIPAAPANKLSKMFPTSIAQPLQSKLGIASSCDVPAAAANKLSKMFPTSVAQPLQSKLGIASSCDMPAAPNKLSKLSPTSVAQPLQSKLTCILEFDGASKGNPGKAGAGAILRTEDGNVVSRVREGLGIATNNVAEYRALILGMKYALLRGFKHIRVHGDSQLVCMQVQDLWQTKNQNMADLCKEAKRLKDMFQSFNIIHVRREFNSLADNLANLAITLQVGEVCEDSGPLS